MDLLGATVASLPWAALYAVIFVVSRLAGPLIFAHCRKLDDANLSYWAESVVSTANSFILSTMAWQACRELDFWNPKGDFTVNSPLSYMCCHALLGYTVWDSLPLIYYRKSWGGFGMYCMHHTATIVGWGLAAATGLGHNFAVPVQMFEATGPFTNLRWFLSTAGLKSGTLYIINGLLMFLSFLLLRVVLNLWIGYAVLWAQRDALFSQAPPVFAFAVPPLYVINVCLQLMWFQKICKGIVALLAGGSGSSGKAKRKKKA